MKKVAMIGAGLPERVMTISLIEESLDTGLRKSV